MGLLANIDHLAHDERKSTEGVPLDLDGGLRIWVRRAGGHNTAYRAGLARLAAERALEIADAQKRDDYEALERINRQMEVALDSRVLVSRWEGFVGPDGEPAECTEEAVAELFGRCPDVHRQVREIADDGEAFRLDADTKSDS